MKAKGERGKEERKWNEYGELNAEGEKLNTKVNNRRSAGGLGQWLSGLDLIKYTSTSQFFFKPVMHYLSEHMWIPYTDQTYPGRGRGGCHCEGGLGVGGRFTSVADQHWFSADPVPHQNLSADAGPDPPQNLSADRN